MFRRVLAFTLTFMIASSLAAVASDGAPASATPIRDAVISKAAATEPTLHSWAVLQEARRPAALNVLYGTYGALQAMDIVSTRRAIAAGAQERNPVMQGGKMSTMIAVKAATGASTIFFAERMWKRNRVGAVIVMAALNGASAAIVAHNQRNARR